MLNDFGVVIGVSVIFIALAWLYMRSINAGRPLRPIQREMLLYGFLFVFGMGSAMLLIADLRGPKRLLFPIIGLWGVLLAAVAWWRHRNLKHS